MKNKIYCMTRYIEEFIKYIKYVLNKYEILFDDVKYYNLDSTSGEATIKVTYMKEYFYCRMERKTNSIMTFNFTDYYQKELNKWLDIDCSHLTHSYMIYYNDVKQYKYDYIIFLPNVYHN